MFILFVSAAMWFAPAPTPTQVEARKTVTTTTTTTVVERSTTKAAAFSSTGPAVVAVYVDPPRRTLRWLRRP